MITTSLVLSAFARPPPSSDMSAFRKILSEAKHIIVLSGAGISAESGVPTFRGAGGFWRTFQVKDTHACVHVYVIPFIGGGEGLAKGLEYILVYLLILEGYNQCLGELSNSN